MLGEILISGDHQRHSALALRVCTDLERLPLDSDGEFAIFDMLTYVASRVRDGDALDSSHKLQSNGGDVALAFTVVCVDGDLHLLAHVIFVLLEGESGSAPGGAAKAHKAAYSFSECSFDLIVGARDLRLLHYDHALTGEFSEVRLYALHIEAGFWPELRA